MVWDYMRFFDYLTNKMIIGKGREIVKIILPIKGSFLNELTGVLLGDGLTKNKKINFKNLAQSPHINSPVYSRRPRSVNRLPRNEVSSRRI